MVGGGKNPWQSSLQNLAVSDALILQWKDENSKQRCFKATKSEWQSWDLSLSLSPPASVCLTCRVSIYGLRVMP